MDQDQNDVKNVEQNSSEKQKEDLAQLLSKVPGNWTTEKTYQGSNVLNQFQEAQNSLQKISNSTSSTKESDTVSGTTSQQTKSRMTTSKNSGEKPENESQTSSNTSTQKQIYINFKRKICPEAYLLQMLETFKQENMITGNAFHMVLMDLLNLRRLCQAISLARQNGDQLDMEKLVDMLEILL